MPNLIDPRCYAAAGLEPMLVLAERVASAPDAAQRERFEASLRQQLQQVLLAGRDDLISRVASEISSASAGRVAWQAIDHALNVPSPPVSGMSAVVFAIPVVLVAGGKETLVRGTLPDARVLADLLQVHGALGPIRNITLNPALFAETSLEGFSPSRLFAILRRMESERVEGWGDLHPTDIDIGISEQVDLRFVTGIAITGPPAPSFTAVADRVTRWGMPFARAIIQQLGQPGLSLLAIPRPPAGLMESLHRGHRAREDVALQIFLSRELKAFRAQSGDPQVLLAALRPNAILARLVSVFQPERAVEHRFVLHPLDDFDEVVGSIVTLLADCQLGDIRTVNGPSEYPFPRVNP